MASIFGLNDLDPSTSKEAKEKEAAKKKEEENAKKR